MIAKNVNMYCHDFQNIENYEKAISDNENLWVIHHRFETHNSNGEPRKVSLSIKELRALGMYYSRPASELIFLLEKEHKSLHFKGNQVAKGVNIGNKHALGNVLSAETRRKMGISHKGNTNNGIAFIKCIETGEVFRTCEWISKGYKNAYLVARGYRKTCNGKHFTYVKAD